MCVHVRVRVCVRFPSEHSPRAASSARGAPAAPSGRFPCDSTSERHILGKRKKNIINDMKLGPTVIHKKSL